MTRGRLLLAAPLLGLLGAACDLILDVPNPDEVKDLEVVGQRLCECPRITEQGGALVARCEAGVAEGGEEGLRLLAEADCTDCGNASVCYGLATDAQQTAGEDCLLTEACGICTTHTACESFACCLKNFALIDAGITPIAQCCDACIGCPTLLPPEGNTPPLENGTLCLEALQPTLDFVDCLCAEPVWDACLTACGVRPPGLSVEQRREQCPWYYGDCRQCLFEVAADSCQAQDLACKQAPSRPIETGQ